MKIMIENSIITINARETHTAGAGSYWSVSYELDGLTLASVDTGCIPHPPKPLDMLDGVQKHVVRSRAALDDKLQWGTDWDGKKIEWEKSGYVCEHGNEKYDVTYTQYTIREKIVWALSQIVKNGTD